jgi:hypothetical protein
MHLYHLRNYYLGLESSIGVKLSKNIIYTLKESFTRVTDSKSATFDSRLRLPSTTVVPATALASISESKVADLESVPPVGNQQSWLQLLRHSSPDFPRSHTPPALSGQSPPMWFAKGEQPARSKLASQGNDSEMIKRVKLIHIYIFLSVFGLRLWYMN